MSENIFKAYDIRGIYGTELTEELAEKVGRAFVTFLGCKKVVIGQDMRPHSEPLAESLIRGITALGADVIRLGLCSTPMSYYGNGLLGADASIMITASHNPGEYNGFKLCRAEGVPISGDTGIKDIYKLVASGAFAPDAETPGTVTEHDVAAEYKAHIAQHADLKRPIKIAVDFANGMGIVEYRAIDDLLETTRIFDELDGTFPNHEANPLLAETMEAVQAEMRENDYDFGVAFDGDADRAGFLDERGEIIPMDMVTAIIAQNVLKEAKGPVFYDLRSSWSTKEVIAENGGTPMMSRVGHSFIKQQMRENDALFAGELSGHYYFRENYFTESSALAILSMANIVSQSDVPLSEICRPIKRYFASGEINSTVADATAVLDSIRSGYTDGNQFELDGVSVEYDDWWFNVRMSNTEPLVRLNLEAKTEALMESKRDELLEKIRS